MLNVLGRPLPNLGINTEEDKTLYIDIDKGNLDEVRTLAVESTYIISNRSLEELDSLIIDGYFNIRTIKSPKEITARMVASFIETTYADNQLSLIAKRVISLHETYGPIANQLLQALVSLRDDDTETFSKIMSANLYIMISSLEGINKMLVFCKSLDSMQENYSSLVEKATHAELDASDAEHYKQLYDQELTSRQTAEAELNLLKDSMQRVQSDAIVSNITTSNLELDANYKELQVKLDTVMQQKEELAKEFEEYKELIAKEREQLGDKSKDALIDSLNKELQKAQSYPMDKLIEEQLPVLREDTALNARYILSFKEVRPTVYINSFVTYISRFLRKQAVEGAKTVKDYIVIIFDNLEDQYTVYKYRKHGWKINEAPESKNPILVTNIFDFSRLKQEYNISLYDLIVVIDRTHIQGKDVVQMKRAKSFYFINTVNDITDFNLDPAFCIGFFETEPDDKKKCPKYRISPWGPELAKVEHMSRCGKCFKDKIISTILYEAEVVPNKP